jgi:hypothetical protein
MSKNTFSGSVGFIVFLIFAGIALNVTILFQVQQALLNQDSAQTSREFKSNMSSVALQNVSNQILDNQVEIKELLRSLNTSETEASSSSSSSPSSLFASINQSQENMSSDVSELQTEVFKLRNQREPRNISEAFPLYPHSSIDAFNDTYSEMKEGTIAGLPPSRPSPP